MIAAFVALLCAWGALTDSVGKFPDWMSPAVRESLALRVPPPDSAPPDDGTWYIVVDSDDPLSSRDSLVFLNVNLHPVASAIMWPVEWSARTASSFMLAPLREPVVYAERTELIDRAVSLVRVERWGGLMAYPTMVMDGGSGSRLGATAAFSDLVNTGWYVRLSGSMLVNRDWLVSATSLSPAITSHQLRYRSRLAASISSGTGVWVPDVFALGTGATPITAKEQRWTFSNGLSIPLGTWGGVEPSWSSTMRWMGAPTRSNLVNLRVDSLDWFARGDRGLDGFEWSQTYGAVWNLGNRDFEGTPTSGGHQSLGVDRIENLGGGDATVLSFEGTRFLLLGDERYGYRKEDIEPFLKFNPRTIVKMLDPTTLKKRLTQRRVLAFKARLVRMWEDAPMTDPVSFFHFPSLGGEAPARAYGGGRLVGRSVAGATVEYRWPVWRYIDGVAFTELAWAAPDWWQVTTDRLAPGGGVGLRVRTRDAFFFRWHLAEGREGLRMVVTTSKEF